MPRRITEGPYWLTCAHCGAEFEGTWHQFKHWKYEGSSPCCSSICRRAWHANLKRKPKTQYGPCPTCGVMFESNSPKRYCSMRCYVISPDHPARTLAGTEASRRKRLSLPDDVRFNLSTGVVSLPTHQALVDRAVDYREFGLAALAGVPADVKLEAGRRVRRYRSKEAIEHHVKARAMSVAGPSRLCHGCGTQFEQSTPFGRAKFCSPACRDADYRRRYSEKRHSLSCSQCGQGFSGTDDQMRRSKAGRDVCCSFHCRALRNCRLRRRARSPQAHRQSASPETQP